MISTDKTRFIFVAVMMILLTLTGQQAVLADEAQSTKQKASGPKDSNNSSATENECRRAIEILDKMIKNGDVDQAALEMREEASRQLKQLHMHKASSKIGHSNKVTR